MEIINLAGNWSFQLDPGNIGMEQRWYDQALKKSIAFPGSTDEGGFGDKTDNEDTLRLSRKYKYIGAAWYQKRVIIPASWKGKLFSLFLERCMWETRVWVDGHYAGSDNSLSTAHVYNLTKWLTPGVHTISIRVDNNAQVDLGAWSHGWSEEVQTLWNGIIGKIEIRATDPVLIRDVQIYPNYQDRTVAVTARVDNHTGQLVKGSITFQAEGRGTDPIHPVSTAFRFDQSSSVVKAELKLGEAAKLWDEFEPYLYELTTSCIASAGNTLFQDKRLDRFGLREFKAEGPRFRLNDYYIFLRGTHDAGNFPLTGYPAMDKAHWLHIYETAKQYGLNHVRFHSWCPPEAAFEAADEAGIILQAELPLFSIGATPIGKDSVRDAFLRQELERILAAYGNHPSFCLMCMGNELKGDYKLLDSFVLQGREGDPRHLYCTAANNAAEPGVGIQPRPTDEFYVAHEVRIGDMRDVRRCEHLFRQKAPETTGDYAYTLDSIDVPTISHEVGQWAIYPNYQEIRKYTGVLEARNLKQFQHSLSASGMLHQADDFLKSSGALSLNLYREEIERSLRTRDYGGFQLLDIHDYPGQGTSHVGILDAFWDSKGLIQPEQFRRFCDSIVLLLRMPKRVYSSNEAFAATVELSNYSRGHLENLSIYWTLTDSEGRIKHQGQFAAAYVEQGTVSSIGVIELELPDARQAEQYKLELSMAGTSVVNDWSIWIFPESEAIREEADIYIATVWNEDVEEKLRAGDDVLFVAARAEHSEAAAFTPPFWNTQLFPNQPKTMGMLCDTGHAALSNFPTDFHTDWQWWDVFVGARAVDLSKSPPDPSLIVQAIDHPIRNHKLGLLFECRVGKGRLLVSGFDLVTNLDSRLATRHLRFSILQYMRGELFEPACAWQLETAREVLRDKKKNLLGSLVKSIQASSTHWTGSSRHLTDGNSSTFWMSGATNFPHEITIELDREVTVRGFIYSPLQDGRSNGRVAEYAWYVSRDAEEFGEPVAKGEFEPSSEPKQIELDWINDGFNVTRSKQGRFIRFVALSGYGDDGIAAISGIDIVTD